MGLLLLLFWFVCLFLSRQSSLSVLSSECLVTAISVFSKSHANLALKSLIVHVSCHNQNSSVHEKNRDPIRTLRFFCQLFCVFLMLYHQFIWKDFVVLRAAYRVKIQICLEILQVLGLNSGPGTGTAAQITQPH